IVAPIGIHRFIPYYSHAVVTFFAPPAEGSSGPEPIFVFLGWAVALLFIAPVLGLFALLFIRRDLGAAYVFVAGLLCGIISAIISAPISALVFRGGTGFGH